MSTTTAFLIIGADRSMRVAKRPRIRADEIAVRLRLNFPDGWGRTIADLTIDVPDFAPEVKYEQVEPSA